MYRELLVQEVRHARMHFRLYKGLQESREGYLKELNQAPGFFGFTIKAHLDAGIVHMFRVLDKHKNAITVWKFLDFVDSNLELFSDAAFPPPQA